MMTFQSGDDPYDSYIPSAAKESGFVMNAPDCMARLACVDGCTLTIGEMSKAQFETFVYNALACHFSTRKQAEQHSQAAWEYLHSGLVVCDVNAKWWAILELLHLSKKMVLFADEEQEQMKPKRKRKEATVAR
jgi:hypothetical protein